jgi:DNA-binding phage protein
MGEDMPTVWHICNIGAIVSPMVKKTADDAAMELLFGESERQAHAMAVQALLARNALLTALETARAEQGLTKAELASRAGLEASSVRRLLTSKTANPTTENAFRLMAAMGIKLEATLPTGERIELVEMSAPAARRRSAKAA